MAPKISRSGRDSGYTALATAFQHAPNLSCRSVALMTKWSITSDGDFRPSAMAC